MAAARGIRVGRTSSVLSAAASCCVMLALFLAARPAESQPVDLLLRGGHVIDPLNDVDGPMDVAIGGGRILRVGPNLSMDEARTVIDVTGLYVTPGIVDLHCHLASGAGGDGFTFRAGVTTCVDAGSYGWRNFQLARDQIAALRTRWYVILAITGNKGSTEGGHGNELLVQDYSDYDPVMTAAKIRQNRDLIVGVKVWKSPDFWGIEQAVEAGRLANVPVMIDFGEKVPPLSLEKLLLQVFRPGDIYTHAYAYHPQNRESIVDEAFRVRPYVWAARERGIVFDVGHGGGAFSWGQAVPASQQGFFPDVISTDLHRISMNGGMKDMTNVMSKFLNLGMSLQQVIHASTWRPAQVIRREELGHLSVGAEADVAVFTLREGRFGFLDSQGRLNDGTQKLEAELTLRAGEIVWDLNGIAGTRWDE
jgi:dihydroorotase